MESSREIEERAGAWLARRESGNWDADDEASLNQWLNASTANKVAFLRLEGAWERALRLQALKGTTPSGAVPSPDGWRLSPFIGDDSTQVHSLDPDQSASLTAEERERDRSSTSVSSGESPSAVNIRRSSAFYRSHRALAACLVLVVVGVLTWYYVSTLGSFYQTPVGGFASVPMTDGSKVTLNTDSAVRLAVTERERRIELERGEAFFDVAKDRSRPFVVSVGDKRVIAVGTKFSVRRVGEDVEVFVTEGKVMLEDASLSARSRKAADPSPIEGVSPGAEPGNVAASDGAGMLLTAGAVARAGASSVIVQEKSLPEVEDLLSWRSGYLTFRDMALKDAITEFNRYNERKIFIRDPKVAAIRFSGKIRPTNFEGFVRLLQDAFPIHAEYIDGRIVLTDADAR